MAVNTPLPESVADTNFKDSSPESPSGVKSGPHDLLINVLGTSFSITVGENPDYLDEVLSQYRFAVANTQGISGMKDPLKEAILTGFLLCDEVNKLKMKNEDEQAKAERQKAAEAKELNHITQNIITRIDKIIND
jgi:cell division protein ZapA (FtsZ GTPase activity inhibitor)